MSTDILRSACAESGPPSRHRSGISIDALVVVTRNFLSMLHIWRTRARARRELAALGPRELQDMGTNWSEIADEVSKPFWRG
jgi:uncharacterized protein YjiS (DUF1127 family)